MNIDKIINNTVKKVCLTGQLTVILETIIFLQEKRNKLEQELDKIKENEDG